MDPLVGTSGRVYAPLPADGDRGFPQSFPLVFAGTTYQFLLYVDASPSLLADKTQVLDLPYPRGLPPGVTPPVAFDLPVPEAFLVVRVDQGLPDGSSQLLFVRKVVPGLEYEAGAIALTFPTQLVAVQNLNGQGAFGSQITGGIAPRWA
ncbi:MAG TPA: hypothetical protein VFE78_04270 [Gemmataceae bacterium]|jgi:hypothetical protein|nr:hypothetical protein [Gemmataceae bacterium]